MTYYKHTQFGAVILAGISLRWSWLFVYSQAGRHPVTLIVAALLLVLGVMFASLTVEVTLEAVKIRFGAGPVRKSFAAAEIRSARQVRNHWVYGWGIRLTPHGWLFNVSGLDAIELEMADGKHFRIGTDQPVELLSAIRKVTGGR